MTLRIASFAAGVALSALLSVSANAAETAASTVDRPLADIAATAADAAATQTPGSVGAMHYAVAGVATSSDDVRRQNHGLLTAANARWIAAPITEPGF